MQKVCKVHGLTEFSNGGGNRSRCKKCAVISVDKRRKKIKVLSVEYKGGKCIICGYNKCIQALQFHHRDPLQKEFSISANGNTRSWDEIKKELDKCDLLCANCHAETHAT